MRENALVGFQEEKTDLSNRTSLTAPDGSITTYGYDTLNRLNGIANSWAGSFGFGYDALSRRTQLTRPNGITTNYTYDSLSRLLSVLHQSGSTILDGASYTYDAAGNRLSKTNYLNGITEGYTYDNLYELTQVVQGATTTENYSYDPVGNRLSSLGVPLYNYNASNQLLSTSLGNYSYDQNGNQLSDAAGKSFTWDFENRLTQATVPQTGGGSTTVTFKYDPLGRRIQKASPSGVTNFLYDGRNIIEEVNGGGSVISMYTHSQSTDEALAEFRSSITAYDEADGLGSVTSLTDSSAATTATHIYDAFGSVSASTGSATSFFRYAGREFDPEIGEYFYRARFYDPQTGRFLTEDPLRWDLNDTSFYSYVGNNPIIRTDPSGLIHQAWKEPPFDGRLHDDPGAGLEVLCKKGRNIASDRRMLEHSILVRSLEIGALLQSGEQPDAGHSLRLSLEIATWKRCKDECDKDKKPDPETEPFEIPQEWQQWLENNWDKLKYTLKHPPQPVMPPGITPVLPPIPVPIFP